MFDTQLVSKQEIIQLIVSQAPLLRFRRAKQIFKLNNLSQQQHWYISVPLIGITNTHYKHSLLSSYLQIRLISCFASYIESVNGKHRETSRYYIGELGE